jgi:hypothetical protein
MVARRSNANLFALAVLPRPLSCTVGLLEKAGKEVEAQLKPQLSGMFGGMIRGYLPQTWVFETEEGSASLHVEKDGRVTASAGALPAPDLTVKARHAALATALKTRKRDGLSPGAISATPHTEKGRMAFQFFRSRLGV